MFTVVLNEMQRYMYISDEEELSYNSYGPTSALLLKTC